MKKEKKVFKHGAVEKVPYLVAFFLMIFGFLFPHILGDRTAEIFGYQEGSAMALYVNTMANILLSMVLLLLFTRWFYPEFKGFFKSEKGEFKKAFMLSIPFFAFWIIWYMIQLIAGISYWGGYVAESVVSGFNAGVIEEVAFRALAVTLLLRNIKKESRVIAAPIFVGILFGLMHFLNLTSGQNPVKVCFTAVFAIAVGIILGDIYVLSGNLWMVIIAHGLYDAIVELLPHIEEDGFEWINYIDVAGMVIMAICYVVFLVKKKNETHALWNQKWNGTVETESEINLGAGISGTL
ncbi:MAG: CPBP family intramembrane metalloprotease [Butyrivibrio sp.]|nr:CPBP family intramembrane metalloprotease [Butyrivibrio sp.]